MKTLTKLLLPVSCVASLLTSSLFGHHTDFEGPGAPIGSVPALDKGPVTRTKNIGTPYKFTYRGLQCIGHGFGGAQGSANAGTSYYTTDSTYQPTSPSKYTTTPLTYGSKVNSVSSPTITFANQYQASWCGSGVNELKSLGNTKLTPMQIRMNATPTVFKNTPITLTWTCTTTLADCDPWTVLTILGDIVLTPPIPQGVLDVRAFAMEGASFEVGWNVTRDY